MNKSLFRTSITIALTVGLVAVGAYLSVLTANVVSGVSLVEDPPACVARVQVLAASGTERDAKRAADQVLRTADDALDIHIVEVRTLELRSVTRSAIIARIEDRSSAQLLAERLGLDPDDVIYQPLEHNTRQVTATLIVGPDYEEIRSRHEQKKESQKQS